MFKPDVDNLANLCGAGTFSCMRGLVNATRIPALLVASALLAGCATLFDDPDDIPFENEAPRTPTPVVSTPAATPTASTTTTTTEVEEFARDPNLNLNDPDAYVLGNGDSISILVFDETDLTMDAQIGDSGEINYSYLGALQVSGKTPVQLEREITSALKDGFLVNPSVNVTIKEYRPFFITGEVGRPGSYSYQPGLTLEKAISIAGGLTDRASSRRMYVVRADAPNQDDKKRLKMSSPVGPGDVIEISEGFF